MKIDEFSKENILKLRSFCIYGLGATGMSVVNYFNRENFKRYEVWDDNIPIKTKVDNKIKQVATDKIVGLNCSLNPVHI